MDLIPSSVPDLASAVVEAAVMALGIGFVTPAGEIDVDGVPGSRFQLWPSHNSCRHLENEPNVNGSLLFLFTS